MTDSLPRRSAPAVALAFVLIACIAEPTLAGSFPVKITDGRGKAITIQREPKRIVSLAPSNTEILFALGLDRRIVGVTNRCDYPPGAKKKPKIGDQIISVERVLAARPDLVVAHAVLNAGVIPTLERKGLCVIAVDPITLVDLMNDILKLGRATGSLVKAGSVAESMRADIQRAKADPKGEERRTVAVVQINPPWAAGSGTMVDELIEIAGGRNVAAGVKGYKQISNEKLLALDPEVVLILSPEDEGMLKTSFWRSTKAVRKGHYYKLDSDIFVRPTPRIVEGLKMLQDIYASIENAQ